MRFYSSSCTVVGVSCGSNGDDHCGRELMTMMLTFVVIFSMLIDSSSF